MVFVPRTTIATWLQVGKIKRGYIYKPSCQLHLKLNKVHDPSFPQLEDLFFSRIMWCRHHQYCLIVTISTSRVPEHDIVYGMRFTHSNMCMCYTHMPFPVSSPKPHHIWRHRAYSHLHVHRPNCPWSRWCHPCRMLNEIHKYCLWAGNYKRGQECDVQSS